MPLRDLYIPAIDTEFTSASQSNRPKQDQTMSKIRYFVAALALVAPAGFAARGRGNSRLRPGADDRRGNHPIRWPDRSLPG